MLVVALPAGATLLVRVALLECVVILARAATAVRRALALLLGDVLTEVLLLCVVAAVVTSCRDDLLPGATWALAPRTPALARPPVLLDPPVSSAMAVAKPPANSTAATTTTMRTCPVIPSP
jgi:hypothetical protein